jgi:ApbE superfamily uncharacterized protein (UPF0280 family)
MTAQASLLPDGRRLHLNDGPIDALIEAWGEPSEVRAAYDQVTAAFRDVLPALMKELTVLRWPLGETAPNVRGPVACRMLVACWPFRNSFITPMAALAGAVADHLLTAMLTGRTLRRAYVNDGGDIAFHLAAGERLTCGVAGNVLAPAVDGKIEFSCDLPVRGIATSGAATKGTGRRSFSLGIADAVTVLARDAAAADAAAAVVGNAVDLPEHSSVIRRPAADIDPDSDLGGRQVTLAVGTLAPTEIDIALTAGLAEAERLRQAGLIYGAVLTLQGRFLVCGDRSKLMQAA